MFVQRWFLNQLEKNCSAKIIKRVFTKSEMGKKRSQVIYFIF